MALFRPLILCYHAVSDTWNDRLAMPTAHFEQQLESLVERGFRGVTAAEMLRRPDARRLLHVTFDDGFKSIANAMPVLDRLGLPATIFVCTDLAASGGPLQVVELEHLPQVEERATLTWESLRTLQQSGLVEVGSHTRSHAHLTSVSDDELHRELQDSKAAIEDELGRPCGLIAYPYGEHDKRVRSAVRDAGYLAAFAAPGHSINFDILEIPRTTLWRDESTRRRAAKTRYLVRIARELRLTPRPRSPR